MDVTFEGPAGQITATLDEVDDAHGICVLAHPHPLYGGSRHDGVLASLVPGLRARSMHCLRFDFRGAGGSEGTHDHGVGEVQDLLAAAAWARARLGELPLTLIGYSFGAVVTVGALADSGAAQCTLIAPPVGRMAMPAPPCAVRIVAGDQDDFAPAAALQTLCDAAPAGSTLALLPGADHFFTGSLPALADAVQR